MQITHCGLILDLSTRWNQLFQRSQSGTEALLLCAKHSTVWHQSTVFELAAQETSASSGRHVPFYAFSGAPSSPGVTPPILPISNGTQGVIVVAFEHFSILFVCVLYFTDNCSY